MSEAATSTGQATGGSGSGQGAGAASASATTATGGGQAAAAAAAADWTTGFDPVSKDYVTNKGFRGPGDLLNSYQNLEKLMGGPKEKLIRLPDKADDPAWKDIFGKLGRPEKPEEYKLPVPEGDKGEFAKTASEWFHEAGVSRSQAEKIAAKWNEFQAATVAQTKQAQETKINQGAEALRQEWGGAYDQNMAVVDRMAAQFGLKEDQLVALRDSLGPQAAAKLLHSIGSKLSEDSFVTGGKDSSFGAMSSGSAQARINSLKGDSDFRRRLMSGDVSAKEEWTKLHKMAFPGEVSL